MGAPGLWQLPHTLTAVSPQLQRVHDQPLAGNWKDYSPPERARWAGLWVSCPVFRSPPTHLSPAQPPPPGPGGTQHGKSLPDGKGPSQLRRATCEQKSSCLSASCSLYPARYHGSQGINTGSCSRIRHLQTYPSASSALPVTITCDSAPSLFTSSLVTDVALP